MSPWAGVVDRVIDGDTMWIRVRIRTRTSAAPSSTAPGAAAEAALKALYPRGTRVWVSPIITDQWGRVVATLERA
jgi:endonuclease YncB( thermonuclease family)